MGPNLKLACVRDATNMAAQKADFIALSMSRDFNRVLNLKRVKIVFSVKRLYLLFWYISLRELGLSQNLKRCISKTKALDKISWLSLATLVIRMPSERPCRPNQSF